MSFREKSAWITLFSVLLTFGAYYGGLATGLIDPYSLHSFHFGLSSIVVLIVLQVALHIIAALMNPKDARTPRDEREKMIQARSHTFGYYVMMIGMLVVVVLTHVPGTDFMSTVYLGVLTMVIAALSVAIAQIVMFRRGG
jgi:ABC-type Co2+ transport system permease subunit